MAVTRGNHHYSATRHPAAKKKKNEHPEQDYQIKCANYLRYALPPDWRFTASAAGVYLGERLGKLMKDMGQEPGWTDLIFRQVGTGATRWYECKSDAGVLSKPQERFRDDCPEHFAMGSTLEHLRDALIGWGIRPTRTIEQANRYYVPPANKETTA